MKRLTTVCHVGHTKTGDDLQRIIESMEWMTNHGYTSPTKSDFVELRKGRDFLTEKKIYDVVILHFIFRGGFLIQRRTHDELATSPESSWYSWRQRLISTQAKLIFAFGGAGEVGGTFLSDLKGYKTHKVLTADSATFGTEEAHRGLWVYERLT